MNFFHFYNLSPSFFIDEKALKSAYYEKMRSLHPDMNMHAGEQEKEQLLQESSMNNTAYNTLRDFHKRLQFIFDTYTESTDTKKNLPQEFLMEMMDVNEELMELQFDYSKEKAEAIENTIIEQQKQSLKALEVQIIDITPKFPLEESLAQQINEYLLKRNYLKRIIESIEKLAE